MEILPTFLFFLLIASHAYSFITCPGNGIRVCTSSDSAYTISTPTILSNCVYDQCPQIVVANTALTISNVIFKNSDNSNGRGGASGGAIYVSGSNAALTILNSHFINCSAADQGGALYWIGPSNNPLIVNNTVFEGNNAVNNGGAVRVNDAVDIYLTNSKFVNNAGFSGGGIQIGIGSLTMNGVTCQGNNAIQIGGCLLSFGNPSFVVSNLQAYGCYSSMGGVITVNGDYPNYATTYIIRDSIISGNAQPFFIYGTGIAGVNATNVTFSEGNQSQPQPQIFTLNVPIFVDRCIFSNIYGTCTYSDTDLTVTNSLVIGNNALGSGPLFDTWHNVRAFNTRFENNFCDQSYGCALYLRQGAIGTVNGCYLANNSATYGGGICLDEGAAAFITNSTLNGNIAFLDGGGIYSLMGDSLVLGPNVSLVNNYAAGSGGALGWAATSSITLNGPHIFIANNSAGAIKSSAFVYISTDIQGSLFLGDPTSSSYIEGGVYVQSNVTAQYLIGVPSQLHFFSNYNLKAYFCGFSCYLDIVSIQPPLDPSSNNSIHLFLSDVNLPAFYITANDYFGNIAEINFVSLIVISVSETAREASLSGEISKAIVDEGNNLVPFDDLSINNPSPGTYQITFKAIGLSTLANKPSSLSVKVVYQECDPVSQRFISDINSCVAALPMNANMVRSLSILGVSGSGLCLFTIAFLFFRYGKKGDQAYMGEFKFKASQLTGSMVSLLALSPYYDRNSLSCMASAWIENIGFSIIMSSVAAWIWYLTVASEALSKTGKKVVKFNRTLSSSLSISVFVTFAVLIVWTISMPTVPTEILILSSSKVITDSCSSTVFNFVTVLTRFVVSLLVAAFAFTSKNIRISGPIRGLIVYTYNWVIFGSILSVIGEFVVSDPDQSFLISSIALILPNFLGTLGLVIFIGNLKGAIEADPNVNDGQRVILSYIISQTSHVQDHAETVGN